MKIIKLGGWHSEAFCYTRYRENRGQSCNGTFFEGLGHSFAATVSAGSNIQPGLSAGWPPIDILVSSRQASCHQTPISCLDNTMSEAPAILAARSEGFLSFESMLTIVVSARSRPFSDDDVLGSFPASHPKK